MYEIILGNKNTSFKEVFNLSVMAVEQLPLKEEVVYLKLFIYDQYSLTPFRHDASNRRFISDTPSKHTVEYNFVESFVYESDHISERDVVLSKIDKINRSITNMANKHNLDSNVKLDIHNNKLTILFG